MQVDMEENSKEIQVQKNEKLKKQISDLRSGNRGVIMDALKEIREESDLSILEELFTLLLEREEEDIRVEVCSILNDLKSQEAAPVLAGALENPEYLPIARELAAACWQNGLHYGEHAPVFVKLALEAGREPTREAVTGLEEARHELGDREKQALISRLKAGITSTAPEKQALLHSLVSAFLRST